jgi:Tfp pilus assembly protein PilE
LLTRGYLFRPSLVIALIAGTILIFAVIGILAAVAIPAYSSYVGKAHVSQAYPQAMAATQVLDRYFVANGKLPDTAAEANLPAYGSEAADLHYDIQTGQVVVEFSQGQGTLAGRHLNFTPTLLVDNTLEWKCSSKDIRPEMLVAQCK